MNCFKRRLTAALLLAAAFALGACAQLGLQTPETFNQKVAVAYVTVTQVRETATQLVANGTISADDALNVQTASNVARTGIDTARALHATDPAAGNAKLESIRVGLNAVVTYLNSRKKK